MRISLPGQVKKIIEVLETAGYEAYAVGGCVRDSILGREPEDWDITTSAKPKEVKRLFKKTVDTGIAHGTVTVLLGGSSYEVTTYRIDGEYADRRHPKEVCFTANLTEDLRRRDFTMNAMAYSEKNGLVDVFGGMEDLRLGVIRCVGEPRERFGEDALRILRAVRFSAQLGFSIEDGTAEAAGMLSGNLRFISAERIRTELVKLLVSPHPETLRRAYEMGMTAIFLPEFDACMRTSQNTPHHCYNVGEHTLKALQCARADKVIRLSLLCHDFGKPAARTTKNGVDHFHGHAAISEQLALAALQRLKFDNDTIRKVRKLVSLHEMRPVVEETSKGSRVFAAWVRRLASRCGTELFPALLEVRRADILAQSEYQRTEKLALLEQVAVSYKEILEKQECLSLKELAVDGKDLLAAGVKPGKQIGGILERMLQDVLENPQHNTRECLLGGLQRGHYR